MRLPCCTCWWLHDDRHLSFVLLPTLSPPLAGKGHAPALVHHETLAGGFMMIVYEYLDPSDGWRALHEFNDTRAEPEQITSACIEALSSLHSCLEGRGVHGDPRPPNIFLKMLGSHPPIN